ncbi:MAG: DUF4238 domain-containing protein, partial [Proteobacteria bacterium]|nr:DUF4238 domain-containing protein [Pseudomonadota bacterium]
MPKDHYISQVHLRNFYSPDCNKYMYAIRKLDLSEFRTPSGAVCRIMDGSTNAFVLNSREIEVFLKDIEPNYNSALEKLRTNKIDTDCIYTIAGFVAYVTTCSPTAMRIQTSPIEKTIEAAVAVMDKQGLLPPSPPILDNKSLTQLIQGDIIKVQVDPKYTQAIGIKQILRVVANLGNCRWEILHNNSETSMFFSSDFPVALEKTSDPRVYNKVIPLAPDLAIRIKPDSSLDRKQLDLSFSRFSYRNCKINHKKIVKLNRLIVRCAEDLIFYNNDFSWVKRFVDKNRHYRIEPQ